MKKLFLFFMILAGSQKLFAQTQAAIHYFSIQDCLDYAYKNNLQVKNSLLDLKIQQQSNRATTGLAYPNINGSANATDYLKIPTTLLPGEFFGQAPGTYIPVKFGTKYNASGTVTLQQVLFDGQVFVGLQARQASIEYRQKSIDLTEENIRANIYKVYYQLVVSKTQIEQINANIERSQNLLHVNNELYKNGFAEHIDVDRTNVQLANLQTGKQTTTVSINNGYLGLKFLMGMPVQDSLVLTDTVTEDMLKKGLLNEDVYKYTDRNDYQLLQLTAKLQQYNVKRYKVAYYPTVNLNSNYTRQGQSTQFNIFKTGQFFTSAYVGLTLSVPIFDGFQKDANIKQAKYQLQQTQNQLENLKLSIDNDVMQAINNYHSAINTLGFQKKNVDLAVQVYNQAQKRYESGLGSTIDITNAQTDLTVAQSNYISAMYDAVIAQVDYLKATGQLK